MRATDAIVRTLHSTQMLVQMFLGDLSDADILVRPVEGANHIAWQLGHLISSEVGIGSSTMPGIVYPELPAGFKEQHDNKNAASDTGFSTKAVYLDLLGKVRAASIAGVEKVTDAELVIPTEGPMKDFAPNRLAMILVIAEHTLMHAGQFSVVRRRLGKPIVF